MQKWEAKLKPQRVLDGKEKKREKSIIGAEEEKHNCFALPFACGDRLEKKKGV